METMRAVQALKACRPEELVIKQLPKPQRKPGEVLVNMHASSINSVDTAFSKMPNFALAKPKTLGGDVAGIVEDSDPNSKFPKGTRIFGLSDGWAPQEKSGVYADWACIKEQQIAAIPDGISFEQAGAAPMVAITALQTMEQVKLQAGDKVLIHGGAGGVGHVVIQLAKLKGAHVIVTCSASSVEFVKRMGADEVIDYRTTRFEEVLRGQQLDCIVDSVGGDYSYRGRSLLKKKTGVYLHIFNQGWTKKYGLLRGMAREGFDVARGTLLGKLWGPRYKAIIAHSDGAVMEQIAGLMQKGDLKIAIDSTYPLDSVIKAICHFETGHPKGKVVLKMT